MTAGAFKDLITSVLLVAALAFSAGCMVGPNYHPPASISPPAWSSSGSESRTNTPADLASWWTVFQDHQLTALIDQAAGSNYNMKAAQARVKAVRALRGAVLANFLPTIDMDASYTKARQSVNALAFPVSILDTDTYKAGFDATWEIDVFGGQRRSLEAANATLASYIEDQRDVLVSLLAEVAVNYIEARGVQRRLEIARENIAAQREAVDIADLRFKAGFASELDLAQAKALMSATESQVPALESALRQFINHISVLTGQPPGALVAEFATTRPIPPTPPSVPLGLPADLLTRRPDVRRSERQLASANAQIGIATAELFPKFTLTGAAGYTSLHTSDLFSPASKFWSVGPSVTWRLLEYPRLHAAIQSQNAQQEQALAQYYQTVLNSLEDVENAIVAYEKEQERHRVLDEGVKSNRRALELASELYTKGLGEFLNVVDAERSLYIVEDQLAQSEQAVSVNLVSLYKALGGGWDPETNQSVK